MNFTKTITKLLLIFALITPSLSLSMNNGIHTISAFYNFKTKKYYISPDNTNQLSAIFFRAGLLGNECLATSEGKKISFNDIVVSSSLPISHNQCLYNTKVYLKIDCNKKN